MDVILLSDVEKLGLRGEVVAVANGYARNFLLPRRLAERATPGRVAQLERRDAEKARHEARTDEQAREIAGLLGRTVLRFEVKAGPGGALFGSVTSTDIADELWRVRRIRVDRRKIGLAEPIKQVGRYAVPVEVFAEVTAEVKTMVVPEGGELPPEEAPDAPAEETPDAPAEETPDAPAEETPAAPAEETGEPTADAATPAEPADETASAETTAST